MRCIDVLFFTVFIVVGAILGAESPSIAVSDLEGLGLSKDEATVMTDKLRSELSGLGQFKVLERGKMDMILKEQGFQQTGSCTESSCFIEMGQLLGVEQMVAGNIGRVGQSFTISARIFSVKTGEIIRDISMTYKGSIEDLLDTQIPIVAKKLAGQEVKPAGSHFWWWVAGGAVVLGGAGAAYVMLNDGSSSEGQTEKANFDFNVRW